MILKIRKSIKTSFCIVIVIFLYNFYEVNFQQQYLNVPDIGTDAVKSLKSQWQQNTESNNTQTKNNSLKLVNSMNLNKKSSKIKVPNYKYFLTAVIIVRIYTSDKAGWSRADLKQWIHYMQYAGVEHVYLYDNYKYKNESLLEFIEANFNSTELSYNDWSAYHPWSSQLTQVRSYNHALSIGRQTSQWQIAIDMDEYPFAETDYMPGFLTRFIHKLSKPNKNIAEFSIKNFLFLGKRQRDKEYLIEQVLRRTPKPANALDKAIYRTKCVRSASMHHNKLKCGRSQSVNPGLLRMNHYWHARLQHWGNDTQEVINMTVPDSSGLVIADRLRQMAAGNL